MARSTRAACSGDSGGPTASGRRARGIEPAAKERRTVAHAAQRSPQPFLLQKADLGPGHGLGGLVPPPPCALHKSLVYLLFRRTGKRRGAPPVDYETVIFE